MAAILCEPDREAKDVFMTARDSFIVTAEALFLGLRLDDVHPVVDDVTLAEPVPLLAPPRSASEPSPRFSWESTGRGRTAGPKETGGAAGRGAAAAAANGLADTAETADTVGGATEMEDTEELVVGVGSRLLECAEKTEKALSEGPFGLIFSGFSDFSDFSDFSSWSKSLSPPPLHLRVP